MEYGELDYGYHYGRDRLRHTWHVDEDVSEAYEWRLSMTIINLPLMKHPLNWFTILFMLVLAGMLGHLLLSRLGVEPATPSPLSKLVS